MEQIAALSNTEEKCTFRTFSEDPDKNMMNDATPLVYAARMQNLRAVLALLKKGAHSHAHDYLRNTFVHYLASTPIDDETWQQLCHDIPSKLTCKKNGKNQTPITIAQQHAPENVRRLKELGTLSERFENTLQIIWDTNPDINSHEAPFNDALELLKAGADINQTIDHGYSLLTLAARFDNKQALDASLEHPNTDISTQAGAALRIACDLRRPTAVKALLESPRMTKEIVNAVDARGLNALQLTLLEPTIVAGAPKRDNTEIVRMLVESPLFDPATITPEVFSSFYTLGSPEITRTLLPYINPNDRISVWGPSLTSSAYYADSLEHLKVLLEDPRIDPNIRTVFQNTPLHRAVEGGNLEGVRALLAHPKINPLLKNEYHKTPLDLARARLNPAIIALLENWHTDELTANNGAGPADAFGIMCNTSSISAADSSSSDDEKHLIKVAPHLWAASLGKLRVTQAFLNLGADPRKTDRDGNTFLHLIVRHKIDNDIDWAQFLPFVNYYRLAHQKNSTGLTPLEVAIKYENYHNALVLLTNSETKLCLLLEEICNATTAAEKHSPKDDSPDYRSLIKKLAALKTSFTKNNGAGPADA